MSTRRSTRYEFPNLPLSAVDAGTNLLLTGPTLKGARELLLRLLLGDDGVLIITADTSARKVLTAFEDVPDLYLATEQRTLPVANGGEGP